LRFGGLSVTIRSTKEGGTMALVQCRDCQAPVSTGAPACPKCGCPVDATGTIQTGTKKTQLVEKTAKRYKGMTVVAVIALITGVVMMFSGGATDVTSGSPRAAFGFGMLIVIVSLVALFVIRLVAWWKHG
jgi:hypothetical protein